MDAQIKSTLEIIRRRQLESKTGLSRSTIYDKINPKSRYYDKDFPRPIKLGEKSVGWLLREVDTWIAWRVKKTRKAA